MSNERSWRFFVFSLESECCWFSLSFIYGGQFLVKRQIQSETCQAEHSEQNVDGQGLILMREYYFYCRSDNRYFDYIFYAYVVLSEIKKQNPVRFNKNYNQSYAMYNINGAQIKQIYNQVIHLHHREYQ